MCGCLRLPNAAAFLVWISYTETGAWKRSQLASDPGTFGKFPGRWDRRTISGTIPGILGRLASLHYISFIAGSVDFLSSQYLVGYTWFNYPGLLLDVEFEFACLSGYVRLVAHILP